MSWLKSIYHRTVPERIRNPIGLARRDLADRLRRALSSTPLPPRELLLRVQMTPYVVEYLRVGAWAAAAIRQALGECGFPTDAPARLLDLGCGPARVTRHLREPSWKVFGCDVDEAAIAWSQGAVPGVEFRLCAASPPTPYDDNFFDVVVAISVITHFPIQEQRAWAAEAARLVRPGGLAVVSTMGPAALHRFPALATPENRTLLSRRGFCFASMGDGFSSQGAFHTRQGLAEFFAPYFILESWRERGLDGFQDLTVFRRLTDSSPLAGSKEV